MKGEAVSPSEPFEARPLQGGVVVIVQVVYSDHPLAAVEQGRADVGPDKSGRAGDEDGHVTIFQGNDGTGIAIRSGFLKRHTPRRVLRAGAAGRVRSRGAWFARRFGGEPSVAGRSIAIRSPSNLQYGAVALTIWTARSEKFIRRLPVFE